MVFKFLTCLDLEKNQYVVFACYFENLTTVILKVVSKAASYFCSGFSLLSLVNFFLVYIHSRLSEQFLESQAGFGTTFKGTGGYQKAGTCSLKKGTGRIFTISM
jgi:hypothetical protein